MGTVVPKIKTDFCFTNLKKNTHIQHTHHCPIIRACASRTRQKTKRSKHFDQTITKNGKKREHIFVDDCFSFFFSFEMALCTGTYSIVTTFKQLVHQSIKTNTCESARARLESYNRKTDLIHCTQMCIWYRNDEQNVYFCFSIFLSSIKIRLQTTKILENPINRHTQRE